MYMSKKTAGGGNTARYLGRYRGVRANGTKTYVNVCVSATYCAKVSGVKFLCVYFAMLLPIADIQAVKAEREAMRCTFRHAESRHQATVRIRASPDESPCKPICASFRTGGSFAPSRNVYRCYGALRRSNRDNQPVHRGYRLPLATPSPAIPGGTDFYKSVRCSSHQHKVSHTANVQSQRRISAP